MPIEIQPKCYNNHMGLWLIEPQFLTRMFQALKSGMMPVMKEKTPKLESASGGTFDGPNGPERRHYPVSNWVAVIDLFGPMMKGESKFGDTCSTVNCRVALRQASRDPGVEAILMVIDSPGGTVAGTEELGNEIASVNKIKPVIGHVDDQCASAAFWAASQCTSISANATALIGSIGTLSVIEDTSKRSEMEGTKVYVVSTGPLKGAFTEGAPVTSEMIDYLQNMVNDTNEYFLKAVSKGRSMDIRNVRKAATGQMYLADVAKEMGLIDSIRSSDETLAFITQKYCGKKMATKATVQDIDLRLRIQKLFK